MGYGRAMTLRSPQGVQLAGVERHTPSSISSASDTVDGFDPTHHHLVWSQRAGVEVRTPRLSMLVTSPSGLWIPGGHPYTVEASAPWWTARFVVDSCPSSWVRLANVTLDEVVAPMPAHLHVHPRLSCSSVLLAAVCAHLAD